MPRSEFFEYLQEGNFDLQEQVSKMKEWISEENEGLKRQRTEADEEVKEMASLASEIAAQKTELAEKELRISNLYQEEQGSRFAHISCVADLKKERSELSQALVRYNNSQEMNASLTEECQVLRDEQNALSSLASSALFLASSTLLGLTLRHDAARKGAKGTSRKNSRRFSFSSLRHVFT